MRNSKDKFRSRLLKFSYLAVCSVLILVGIANANGQNQTPKVKPTKLHSAEVQQPIYREYRGVRLDMTMQEVRTKLGPSVLRSDELDYYVFSPNESAQIAYNVAHKVVTISVDYTAGVGAPDYKTVIGLDLLARPDGSLYRMVQYEAEGFWVSYNKSTSVVPIVTVTLQAMRK